MKLCLWAALLCCSQSLLGTTLSVNTSLCSNSGATAAACTAQASGSLVEASEAIGTNHLFPGAIEVTGRLVEQGSSYPGVLAWMNGTLDIPAKWGSVDVYGWVYDQSDQYRSVSEEGVLPITLTSNDGQKVSIGGNNLASLLPPLSGAFAHAAGTPLSLQWSDFLSCCEVNNSTDTLTFQLDFIDPPGDPVSDTPEPRSLALLPVGFVLLYGRHLLGRTDNLPTA